MTKRTAAHGQVTDDSAMMSSGLGGHFPEAALLPKQETGAQAFLAKNPTYDGRNVVIAVFDSGVDPRAAGLQVTTDGKPKVIQILDGSGAGDVDMKTQVSVQADGTMKGLSGRTLKIPTSWKNPSGKYRIGLKAAFDLYPGELKERIKKDYQEKQWAAHHQPALADATRRLQQFEADHPAELKDAADKAAKDELDARAEVLCKLDKNYSDLGPVYDCVLWNDGTAWKAVIDTSEQGNLEACEVVGPYAETLHCSPLSKEDNLSYVVNVHDNGDTLEIVTITCSHGTHVASIASANFPDNPARNGVAPGAQIISISLSDARVGTMETGTAMYRAMAAVMKLDVDVINMSYGESSKWCKGRIWDHFEEMINKKGIVMMVSAGNQGPALSTLGTPPTQNAMGVGALVTPPMMEAEYSLRDKIPCIGYNWTSRGPGIDGRLGPSFCAPGAAITSVPTYTLQGSQLMNGTSMASPNAAGVASLLVSALKQSGFKYSPYSVRRALENSAMKLPSYEPFANGQGLVQVERAWDWLKTQKDSKENLLRFEIKTDNGRKRGIYLREPCEVDTPQIKSVQIEPVFVNDKQVAHELKTSYDQNFNLSCNASWVQAPSMLNLMYQERAFAIKVDPTSLEEGRAHFTELEAFEAGRPDKGPVFRVPITVIKPKTLPANSNIHADTVSLRPGVPNRTFIAVPGGATWCLIKMKSLDPANASSVNLHTLQFRPDAAHPEANFSKMPTLQPLAEVSYAIKVHPGRTLEVCLSKWWTSFGDMSLAWNVQFFGLKPSAESFHMTSGEGLSRFDVQASLGPEEANPSVSLKQHVIVLKPNKSKISPGGTRDVIPEGRIVHANTLTYTLNLVKGGEVTIGVPLLSNYLYESEFNSQLWMLYDQNKQLLGCGDAFPERYPVKLEKGEYTIMAQVRHEDRSLLEKVTQDLPLQVAVKLSSPLSLDVYAAADQALVQGKKSTTAVIPACHVKPFYVGHLNPDKMPKGAAAGHFLQGSLSLTTDDQGKKVATYPFRYYLSELTSKGGKKANSAGNGGACAAADNNNKDAAPAATVTTGQPLAAAPGSPSKENAAGSPQQQQSGGDAKKTPDEEFEEAACEFCSQQLAKSCDKAEAMYQDLIKRNPQANQLMVAKIQALLKKDKENEADNGKREEINRDVITLADQVLTNVNPEKLLLSLGCRQDKSDQAANKLLEKQKQLVIDVLTKKGEALCNLAAARQAVSSTADAELQAKMHELFAELQRWVDPLADAKTAPFVQRFLLLTEQHGRLARLLLKVQEDKPTAETDTRLVEVFKKLEWSHCVELWQRNQLNKFPPQYRPL